MRVIAYGTLGDHWQQPGRADSERPLRAWLDIVKAADWRDPVAVKSQFRAASFVGDRVVFNIAGNKYRLVTSINFAWGVVYIRFVGSHGEYDAIDVESI